MRKLQEWINRDIRGRLAPVSMQEARGRKYNPLRSMTSSQPTEAELIKDHPTIAFTAELESLERLITIDV